MAKKTSSSRLRSNPWWLIALIVVLMAVAGYIFADWNYTVGDQVTRSYVGRQSCISCHQQEADLFHGSHHDLAMDEATDETVLAKFDGTEIAHYGVRSRVFRDGEKFMVHTEGPDGKMEDFQVKYVFGVEPLQQYMVEMDREGLSEDEVGQVQVLRLSWDSTKHEWFYLSPPDVDEKIDPSDPLHWTGITQRWNATCADCHSTNLKRNYDPLTRKYKTTYSEIDVSCEACHGPGSLHVQLANRQGLFWDKQHGYGLARLKTTSNVPQVETCAPCHSRRTLIQNGFEPGCSFDDYHSTQLIADPIYHVDGQVRDEDYVYGSFIQSKMFNNGIRCTDCHDPHSARLKYSGNQVCTSCHQHPAGKYDTLAHHHHQPGTPGSFCVDCHMPQTTYMDVDQRRDHSFRVPRPDLSVELGTPNACSACHIDETKLSAKSRSGIEQYLDWIIAAEAGNQEVQAELSQINEAMANAFNEWYPEQTSAPRTQYYEDLARGLKNEAHTELFDIASNQSLPAMIRASAAMGFAFDNSPESLQSAIDSLDDNQTKVVAAALLRIEQEIAIMANRMQYAAEADISKYRELVRLVAERLDHPSLRVRAESARVFSGIPAEARQRFATTEQRRAFENAIDEYRRSVLQENDRALNHMVVGGVLENLGEIEKAKDAYRTAISVEPNLAGPRSNLAAILDSEVRGLRQQMQSRPGNSFSVGQLRASAEQIEKLAAQSEELRRTDYHLLKADIERSEGLPNIDSLHYRFAMASYIQGNKADTEKHLLIAHRGDPNSETYLLGLATYYQGEGNPAKAATYINQLIALDPEHPGYLNLAKEVDRQLDAKRRDKSATDGAKR